MEFAVKGRKDRKGFDYRLILHHEGHEGHEEGFED